MTQLSFQADYPGAMVYGADSTNVLNPPANHPKGFVMHTPEEPADGDPGTPRWFARPNVGGSTTYFVSYLGFVVQCVPENVGAIANGVTPPLPYPAWADSNVSLNRQTLSVEIEGYAATIAQTISPAQKTALLNLIRHRCQAHGIPMDRQHIIGHYEVANNRSDPGTLDIDAIVAELQTPIEEDWMSALSDNQQRDFYNKTVAVHTVLYDNVVIQGVTMPRWAYWQLLLQDAAQDDVAIANAKEIADELAKTVELQFVPKD